MAGIRSVALVRSRLVGVLPLLLLLATACTLPGRSDGSRADSYEVTIRRDGHGVPHIVAADFGSLGYGEGYALAQDHACTVADQVLRARGERARHFGRGERDAHLASDVVARAFSTPDDAQPALDAELPETRFWEQTELYAAKRWRNVRFTEEEIRSDPALTITTLRGPRSS